jgi:hypothetical protein
MSCCLAAMLFAALNRVGATNYVYSKQSARLQLTLVLDVNGLLLKSLFSKAQNIFVSTRTVALV